MLHKEFNKDSANLIFKQKNWFIWHKKFLYFLSYLKKFKVVPKNNPRTHSLQQSKKAVLTTDV